MKNWLALIFRPSRKGRQGRECSTIMVQVVHSPDTWPRNTSVHWRMLAPSLPHWAEGIRSLDPWKRWHFSNLLLWPADRLERASEHLVLQTFWGKAKHLYLGHWAVCVAQRGVHRERPLEVCGEGHSPREMHEEWALMFWHPAESSVEIRAQTRFLHTSRPSSPRRVFSG